MLVAHLLSVRCSLFFVRCSLLFARCALFFARCSLLFACCSLVFVRFLWAIARLLDTSVTLIYLVDDFFIFSSLVLLKEMRSRVECKISTCCFCFLCKSREFGGRVSPRFPCVTPVVESSSDFLRDIIS